MSRKSGNGPGSSHPTRLLRLPSRTPGRGYPCNSGWLSFALIGVLFLQISLSVIVQAQNGDHTDVHIAPRIDPDKDKPKEPAIDPSLNTHTRPFRRDADLGLDQVTTPDPVECIV